MQINPLSLRPPHHAQLPDVSAMRRGAAAALHAAGGALQRLGCRLGAAAPTHVAATLRPVRLEFHAEAGAPEGALYVDGQLVAHLAGVRRL